MDELQKRMYEKMLDNPEIEESEKALVRLSMSKVTSREERIERNGEIRKILNELRIERLISLAHNEEGFIGSIAHEIASAKAEEAEISFLSLFRLTEEILKNPPNKKTNQYISILLEKIIEKIGIEDRDTVIEALSIIQDSRILRDIDFVGKIYPLRNDWEEILSSEKINENFIWKFRERIRLMVK